MIRQATVEDIRSQRVTRRHGHIAVVTRYYPRYLKKVLVDEYVSNLAPPLALLEEFKEREKALADHDLAFEEIDYESKFTLSVSGIADLKRLSDLSKTKDIYLVCHCRLGQRCHREILLLYAQTQFGAKTAKVHFAWDTIKNRIPIDIARDP